MATTGSPVTGGYTSNSREAQKRREANNGKDTNNSWDRQECWKNQEKKRPHIAVGKAAVGETLAIAGILGAKQ